MPFLQLHLTIDDADPDAVETACFDSGALSVTLTDAGDSPILEPAPGTTPLWPRVALSALYTMGADPQVIRADLEVRLPGRRLEPRFEVLADRPWVREWLRDFRPMRFGERLWICPGGQTPPRPPPGAGPPVIVWLDPGLAFGTGTHATTALCLDWIDAAALAGQRVLDVGCGSGILSIAALKVGAVRAHAIDIDPQALIATRENAARNGVDASLTIAAADIPWGDGYDVVFGNILAEPLIQLAGALAVATRAGGAVVLSGLLSAQAGAVADAYAPWFDMAEPQQRDGWIRLCGRRRH